MGFKLSHIPLRVASGAYILNSGIGKLSLDAETAAGMQEMAGNAIPQLKQLDPEQFGKLLCYGEMALGSVLLAPFIPAKLAGLGLGAFAGTLVWMYHKTPGMTLPDGIRPAGPGVAYAKDIWLVGIAAALILDKKHKCKSSQ